MDTTEENSSMRISRLRPPSHISSPGKGLSEISESQGNARSKPSMLPPPSAIPTKHKLQQYSEPDPKRKTLAERAGEPVGKSNAAATSNTRFTVKGTSLAGAVIQKSPEAAPLDSDPIPISQFVMPSSQSPKLIERVKSLQTISQPPLTKNAFGAGRNTSVTSSSSSRPPSVLSRTTSHNSHGTFSSSVGQSNRPATSYGHRPGSSFSQSTTTRTTSGIQRSRPATAIAHNAEEGDIDRHGGRRKGTDPLISIPYCFALPEEHSTLSSEMLDRFAIHPLKRSKSRVNHRDTSICEAMTRLMVDEEGENCDSHEHQASSLFNKPALRKLAFKHSVNGSLRSSKNNNGEKGVVLHSNLGDLVAPKTPSQVKVPSKLEALNITPATPCKSSKQSFQKTPFLTKDSNVPAFIAWDVDDRLEHMESMYSKFEETIKSTTLDRNGLEEAITAYKARILDLETTKAQQHSSNQALQHDLETMRQKADMLNQRLMTATANLDDKMRAHHTELDDLKRECRREVDQLRRDNSEEVDKLLRLHRDDLRKFEGRAATDLEEKVRDMERRNDAKLEDERNRRLREVQELESKITSESQNVGLELQRKELELQNLRGELENVKGDVDREQTLKNNAQDEIAQMKEVLKKTGVESSSTIQSLENTVASLRARIHFLESGSKAQSDSFAEMESRLQDAVKSAEVAKQKLIKEETLRRSLFNQVQELKGNIRVMCRVRPSSNGNENDTAKITIPDLDKESKELAILGKEEKSSLGTITRKNHSFTFDRVFGPESKNQEVFEEISQLVQSALDGYNVCIFCYGQTGSGKTHTMSSEDGMIPRATHQIYETATNLKEKGWEYTMEGSFVEVYNEEIHDLLGNSKDSEKKKHDIRHDDSRKQTTVTGLKTVALDSPNTVEMMLKQAANNRSVAATKSNERSSRSHSVFILKLVGRNTTTGEISEGTLNLVDLAGSERLKQSGAEGDRMKETQSINKSLSCLGDVIGALGQGKEGGHIPYRNSKLTYLLQYSLGGNSKTLMFVMASPLEAHLTETLTSLKFATKVHNTHIGTAKKSTKSS